VTISGGGNAFHLQFADLRPTVARPLPDGEGTTDGRLLAFHRGRGAGAGRLGSLGAHRRLRGAHRGHLRRLRQSPGGPACARRFDRVGVRLGDARDRGYSGTPLGETPVGRGRGSHYERRNDSRRRQRRDARPAGRSAAPLGQVRGSVTGAISNEHACANDTRNSASALPSSTADPTETVAERKRRPLNHWGHVPPIRKRAERRTGIWL
jgi:hypothetical protein